MITIKLQRTIATTPHKTSRFLLISSIKFVIELGISGSLMTESMRYKMAFINKKNSGVPITATNVKMAPAPTALLETICVFFITLNACTIIDPTIGIDCSNMRFSGEDMD